MTSDASRAPVRPFETVLVANRGEIACRIIGTLRRLGIRSVAVYSDADREAKHVVLADEAVRIGPSAPRLSYLDAGAIVSAARQTGAQAVHPGYGFLSESTELARACAEAALVFIGPGERALEVMGDKVSAKRYVAALGVPTTPGIDEPGLTDDALRAAAARIGYPVLIKPSAGGGGKGMYAVHSPAELPAALTAARRIAASAFGDDTLFLERLVRTPRHIEVQVLADRDGRTIHLGERECSLQRRHQKVIEEAPSPLLDPGTRQRMGEAACTVARSIGYVGAGTIEFLVSDETPGEFSFMEMNTRLQVEHPVTELVTGIDLVEWQVRIAAGEPLGFDQDAIRLRGHAIEARVYAEDPRHEFVPQAGRIIGLAEATGDGVRVDSSLMLGLEVPPDYDPMLAKVIAWGEDRTAALARLERALADTVVLGVHTNVEYLSGLLAEPSVRAGALDTGVIERTLQDSRFRSADDDMIAAVVAALHAEAWRQGEDTPWARPTGWRIGAARPTEYSLATDDGRIAAAAILGDPDGAVVRVSWTSGDGADRGSLPETVHRVAVPTPLSESGPSRVRVVVDGISRTRPMSRSGEHVWVADRGAVFDLIVRDRAARLAEQLAERAGADAPVNPELRSPMPGTVVSVEAAHGSRVDAGEAVLTVEAMKMEHKLLAPVAGRAVVNVRVGDLVKAGQLVATIDPLPPGDVHPRREEPADAEPAG